MKKTSILLFTTFLLLLAVCCSAEERGKYVSWSVEEYSGWTWTELRPYSLYSREENNTELEKTWRQYPYCTQKREDELRRKHQYNVPALLEDVSSKSSYRIDPTIDRKYRVKVENNTSCRMAVTVEIDGVNSINSTTVYGTSADTSWVLSGNSYIYVKGFQDDSKTAREFYWTDEYDAHSYKDNELGEINIYVYFEDSSCTLALLTETCNPGGRTSARNSGSNSYAPPLATGAGKEIYNPVHKVNFDDLTRNPMEKITIDYSDSRRSWNSSRDDDRYERDYDNRRDTDYDDNRSNDRNSSECYVGTGIRIVDSNYRGVEVTEIIPGGPAWRAGMRNGDILLKADGKDIESSTRFAGYVRSKYRGDTVYIKYKRNGKYITANLNLDYVCWD